MLLSPKRTTRRDRAPEGERVSGRKQIIALLRQLEAGHELLSVTVPNCPDIANTAILGIKEDRGYSLLDEFSTNTTHQAFIEQKKAVIQGHLRGTELRFSCDLVKTGADANIILYAVRIPGEIVRKQRRDQFRLRLSPAICVPVTVPDLDGYRVAGEAYDLSASGLGAMLNTRCCPERGTLLPDVTIALPGCKPFIAKLEVRFSRVESARHMLRLGGRFVAMTQQQERKLEQFLAEQQRKRCRHDSL